MYPRSSFRSGGTSAKTTLLETILLRSGKKKTDKHKHFRRDGPRDKQEPSLGQMGPLPGTKWDPSLGQTGLSLFISTVKSLFCPVCPWDGWGFVPGTIVPQGPSEKCLCVFCLLVFFAPNSVNPRLNHFLHVLRLATLEGAGHPVKSALGKCFRGSPGGATT